MKYSTVILCSICLILCDSGSAKFPNDIKKCQKGDVGCVKDVINYIFENKAKDGVPGIALTSLDPLVIKSVEINQGTESPVNINLKFKDSALTGISTIKSTKTTGFGTDIKGTHEIFATGDLVSLAGQYEIQGRVLLLPINGVGDSNITLMNPDFRIRFHGKPLEKNGKTHMNIEDLKLDMKISRMYINLGNLFNGDKALGETMNAFLNENWEDIFKELKGKILEAFGLIFQNVINNVFAKYPYDQLFSE